jgi:hypothetical protein
MRTGFDTSRAGSVSVAADVADSTLIGDLAGAGGSAGFGVWTGVDIGADGVALVGAGAAGASAEGAGFCDGVDGVVGGGDATAGGAPAALGADSSDVRGGTAFRGFPITTAANGFVVPVFVPFGLDPPRFAMAVLCPD